MTQNDPPEEEPPPLIRTVTTPMADERAQSDAQNERDWELYEAQQKTKQLRGLFANRVYVEPDGKHLRISFGERIGDEDIYHTTVVVPLEEAFQFGDLLTRMSGAGLKQMWNQIHQYIELGLAPHPEEPNGR